jgi:hypothetical protein
METPNVPVNSGNTQSPLPQNPVPPKSSTMKWSLIGAGGLLVVGLLTYFLGGSGLLKGELQLQGVTALKTCVGGIDAAGLTENTNYPLTINCDNVQMLVLLLQWTHYLSDQFRWYYLKRNLSFL